MIPDNINEIIYLLYNQIEPKDLGSDAYDYLLNIIRDKKILSINVTDEQLNRLKDIQYRAISQFNNLNLEQSYSSSQTQNSLLSQLILQVNNLQLLLKCTGGMQLLVDEPQIMDEMKY